MLLHTPIYGKLIMKLNVLTKLLGRDIAKLFTGQNKQRN